MSGPDAFGAKTRQCWRGDFFGQAEANIGLLRLRHGYVKPRLEETCAYTRTNLVPALYTGMLPGVVNFNGIPIAPFGWTARSGIPQKFTDKFNASITAL